MEQEKVKDLVKKLLTELDDAPGRNGLENTPRRVAKFYSEFLSSKDFKMTTFPSEGYDEMIIQSEIPFYSICEHHMIPFFGTGAIAYIPRDKIVGLSKLARTLDFFSNRLQNQERITVQVTDFLNDQLNPQGIAVSLNARHLCMEMRGIKKTGTNTVTSSLVGVFKENHSTRDEFFKALGDNRRQ